METNPVLFEILKNKFQSVAEEMGHVVKRTATTIFVTETADFTTALSTPAGEFYGYPVRVGIVTFVSLDIRDFIDSFDDYEEGDVVFTNDPYTSGGATTQAPDATYLKPVFWEGEIVTYLYCFSHSTDVGGKVPGSVSPTNTEIFQEGVRVPPTKLCKAGQMNEEFLNFFLANCRVPDDIWGDMRAILAAMNTGERRLHELFSKYGKETVLQAMNDVLDYTEQKTRSLISDLPDGTYQFHDFLDDDISSPFPVRLNVELRVDGDRLLLDFHGSEPQVKSAFNIPTLGKKHPWVTHRLATYFMSRDPTLPFNAGLARPIDLALPPESVVNPRFPAAFGVRFPTALRANDVVLGALAKALPGQIPACGGGAMIPLVLSEPDFSTGRRKVLTIQVLLGGTGAMPGQDGIDARNCELASLQNTPSEIVEQKSSVVIRRYATRQDSGGPGKYRGGTGVILEFQVMSPDCIITGRGMERYFFQPWGLLGGMPGISARTVVNPGSAQSQDVGRIDALLLQPGDTLRVETAGGGGYGPPWERDPEQVLDDVLDGFVSAKAAETDYSVVIRGDAVDKQRTLELREIAQQASRENSAFRFGDHRDAHELVWSDEVWRQTLEILYSLPPGARDFAKQKLYPGVTALAKDGPVQSEDVLRTWKEIKEQYGIALT